ncbi:hypothetical protein SK128_019141 [Halocaridina rubra]|uniref:Leptin receptor n=1 Tax=Halocaridina rubra TaxID=373956 RepID=A0AAN8XE32_HALRR
MVEMMLGPAGLKSGAIYIEVIDDFTIRATLNASQPGSYKLLCMSNATGIPSLLCMRSVSVGYPPLDVQDLQCVSWNWHSLECNWSIPENPAQAPSEDYLVYLVTDIKEHPCDESPDDCSQNCCQWRMPAYSPSDPTFNISFNVSNKLGNAIFNHTFNNTDIVIPNPAEKVVIETAEESLEVRTEWVLPLYMETYAEAIGVLCVVEYRPSPHLYGGDTWLLGSFSTCRHKECNATVAVQHPGATYEFRVRLRARRENFTFDEDGWWSLWTAVEGNIPPQRPWNPPNLDIGTFQTNTGSEIGRRDVTVAWRPLPNLEHNGPDFSYVVNATADGKILSYSSITDTYVTFSDVSDEALVSLEVTSSNSMGHCNFSSHVDVYPKHLMPPLPVLPVVVHHPMTQQYELLWNGEESGEYTYTVYICTDGQDNKEACENNLYWIAVGNLTSVNVTLEDFGLSHLNDENIRFAVSEQSSKEGFSSGMSWDNCLSPQTYGMSSSAPDIGESIARNATAANLTWSLECKDRGAVVEAIIVEYCAGSHTFAMPCECKQNENSRFCAWHIEL